MPVITADKVLGHSMYANSTIQAYRVPTSQLYQNYTTGQYIGNVYTWVNFSDGLYWGFLDAFGNPFYVKNIYGNLSLPALPDILSAIKKENDLAVQKNKGVLQYNIDKYAPYIIGAVVIAVAFPTIMGIINKKRN